MNPFAVSGILLGVTCSILLLITVIYHKTRLHRVWFLMNMVVGGWGFSAYFIGTASNPQSALSDWRIAIPIVSFISPSFYHLVCVFCGIDKSRKTIILVAYIQAVVFVLLVLARHFVTIVILMFDSLYYMKSSTVLLLFLFFWIGLMFMGYYELLKYYQTSSGARKTQSRYLIMSTFIGFCGGMANFLPMFGLQIYPYGNFSIPLYCLISTYAILRHRLIDVHVVLKKSIIYSLSVGLLTGLFLLLVIAMTKYLTELIQLPSLTISVICTIVIAFLFNPLKDGIQSFVDKRFYKTTYDYYTTVKKISRDLASSIGLRPTHRLIVDTIFDTLKLRNVYLLSATDNFFEPVCARYADQEVIRVVHDANPRLSENLEDYSDIHPNCKKLHRDSELVRMTKEGRILIKEELSQSKNQDTAIAVEMDLQPYAGEVVVPIFVEDELRVLLILGEKLSADAFSVEDINLLSTISSQASIALKNARLYDELEVRVEERTAQLTLANNLLQEEIAEKKRAEEALKSSNEEIKAFAYIVSHDMRAPLVNIKGFSSELKLTMNKLISLVDTFLPLVPNKEQKELKALMETNVPKAVGFIESSAKRMDVQIGAILKLSRAGRKELHPEKINTGGLIQSTLKTLTHQIEKSSVKVTIGALPEIIADRSSMEQIIGNLLDNALKYLAPGRDGELEITAEQNEKETIFHIRDNGCGIAKDDMQKVFEIFRRIGKQDIPGEGIGLAYVKALIKGLGGRIWCESELGVGTTFSFSIPNSILSGSNSKAFE